jgi:hypothetical protein
MVILSPASTTSIEKSEKEQQSSAAEHVPYYHDQIWGKCEAETFTNIQN